LQWAQESVRGEPESKIIVNSDLVHEIIPHDFSNIDSESSPEKDKENLESLRRELASLRGEKNNQAELKAIRFNSLLVLRQIRSQFSEKEYQNYEGKINTATSREEIEVLIKDFLLKTKQKNTPLKPIKERNRDKKIQDELSKIKNQNKNLEDKIKLFNDEIKKIKGDKSLQGQRNQSEILLTMTVIILII